MSLLFDFVVPIQASDPIDQAQTKVLFNDEASQGIVELIDWSNEELLVQM